MGAMLAMSSSPGSVTTANPFACSSAIIFRPRRHLIEGTYLGCGGRNRIVDYALKILRTSAFASSASHGCVQGSAMSARFALYQIFHQRLLGCRLRWLPKSPASRWIDDGGCTFLVQPTVADDPPPNAKSRPDPSHACDSSRITGAPALVQRGSAESVQLHPGLDDLGRIAQHDRAPYVAPARSESPSTRTRRPSWQPST